jgi:hypothetical protein
MRNPAQAQYANRRKDSYRSGQYGSALSAEHSEV